jgi:hypothetical protein
VDAERADAVAGAEEREVARDDPVEQQRHLPLDAVLDRRLQLRRIARVERPAPDEHPGVGVEVEVRQGCGLHADAVQLPLGQAGAAQERLVLALGRDVLGAGGEQEEGAHGRRS